MAEAPYTTSIAEHIWATKYRFDGRPHGTAERSPAQTWSRVATALAGAESSGDAAHWAAAFRRLLDEGLFLPGGRILAGAGTGRRVTLFNCFVMGVIADDMSSIFENLKEAAITMQQGGGIGYDFSTLRPAGTPALHSGAIASGPVSFMRIWDTMCATMLSTGARRGAMMATLRCDHPDIEAFVEAKAAAGELRRFNLSVQVTDAFMAAVESGADWPLVFPADQLAADTGGDTIERGWPGRNGPVPCRVLRRIDARALWRKIMRATYEYAEPGVLFVDRVNARNNLWYDEHITATNPCGEIPLPPYGACDLGSLNLPRFVEAPFSGDAGIDWAALEAATATAVRMLDNVIEVSGFPLPAQAERARLTRRIGLGVTGLADMLVLLGLRYDSSAGRDLAASVMAHICHTAYRTSIELAREKGPFPLFDRHRYPEGAFIRTLPPDIQADIERHGIRNSHLLAIAPTGTISLLADNVSSGVEPIFAYSARRRVLNADGSHTTYVLEDYAHRLWRERSGEARPDAFVTALEIEPHEHLLMEAALQPYVDNAISKTINVPSDFGFDAFEGLYREAFALGLKGCTTFRQNPVTGSVLTPAGESRPVETPVPCCTPEREAD
ncbi:adenosylcobalamin-dependent ribonucleoside-diphosphate reductase [Ectothiorhodospiraceae bacterium WFHF3C12]|nr:adenosylcobalamin-dependent ribonucleoside-diphosphate reductase [Ectothiorhodospiraceae bacterium WFHF3C12]